MHLRYSTFLLICLVALCLLPFVNADSRVTEQPFYVDFGYGGGWNIQDLYHNNTFIYFVVANSTLYGVATMDYNDVNGTMVITPSTSGVALSVYSNSTDFVAFVNGVDLNAGAFPLPVGSATIITWQWTPSTTVADLETDSVAYAIIGIALFGVACFSIFFILRRKSEE